MVSNGTDNMVMPVAPMYGGYNGCNGNGFGWGGDWAWIILLLLLGGKQEMIDHLNKMMMNARTPEERESYRSTIEHMSRN